MDTGRGALGSMKEKKKIPVSAEFTPWSSTPLAGLNLPDIPDAPSEAGLLSQAAPSSKQGAVPASMKSPAFPEKVGEVILRREKSGRGGKAVLILSGWSVPWTDEALEELGRAARQACGCGGTVRHREIELQGQDTARVRRFLVSVGFRVRGE